MSRRGTKRGLGLRLFVIGAVILGALASSAHADAQDERWVVLRRASLSPDSPTLEMNRIVLEEHIPFGTPARLRLHGSVTDGFDGAEIDALGRTRGGTVEPSERYVGRPSGATVIERDETSHTLVIEVPVGTDLSFTLNVVALASQHLVTASEMRGRLDGAIEVDVSVPESAIPTASPAAMDRHAAAEASFVPYGVGGGGLLAGLLLVLGLRRKREVAPELALLLRAKKAHDKLTSSARSLGPQFEGVIAPGEKLLDAANKAHAHVGEIDRGLKEASFVTSATAGARLGELRADRERVMAQLGDVVSGLEEAVVKLMASRADRSAVDGIANALRDVDAEVRIGREVDAELR